MQFSKTKQLIFHHFSGNKMVNNIILFPREKQQVLLRLKPYSCISYHFSVVTVSTWKAIHQQLSLITSNTGDTEEVT